MATIDDAATIKALIESNGHYEDDPQVVAVWQYHNAFNGRVAYSIHYNQYDLQSFLNSENVLEPLLLWTAKGGTKEGGKMFLISPKAASEYAKRLHAGVKGRN
jgi:hypothetical protein